MSTSRPRRRTVADAEEEDINVSVAPAPEQEQPAEPPTNEGGQVPDQEGTQVGTTPGTSVARTEESRKVEDLDLSLRGALSDPKDPDQDWRKSGWQALRYRKRAVEIAVSFGWRGYKTEQALVDAALAAFLPDELQQTARDMAQKGEL